ncbi:hypothetical protein ACIP98_29020 [Streptomyces sp. NPDC088354]|uniref:hypothetical protein n=1 Tax=Streptomyces sp. NPDC088354 TaxID=3365856 RepID=UPI0038185B85
MATQQTQQTQQEENDVEVIALLMKEYEVLRAEIAQRVLSRMQILGFAGVAAALIAGLGEISWSKPAVYIAVLAFFLGLVWLRDCNQGIQRIGRHLRDVEAEVNRRAIRAYGSSALSWETNRNTERQRERPVWRFVGRLGGWTSRH